MSLRFGLRLPPCHSARVIAAEAVFAEQCGFDSVWLPDGQLLWRELWVTLTAVAMSTNRIRIGTNVTNPVTRHPTVTASAIATLDELSDGRAALGIAPGDNAVRLIGAEPASVAEMRDSIGLIRSLTRGDWITLNGRQVRMKAAEGRAGAVPIYMAASGPRMLQLAGEVADGVMILTGLDTANIKYAVDNIRIGADRAGRRLEDLDLTLGVYCHMGDDRQAARRQARPHAANFAMRFPKALEAAGITVPTPHPMPDLYPDVHHAEDWERAMQVTDWVPDDVLDEFCEKYTLTGDSDDVIRKVERAASQGISHFYLLGFSSYQLPHDTAQEFASKVIPYFRQG